MPPLLEYSLPDEELGDLKTELVHQQQKLDEYTELKDELDQAMSKQTLRFHVVTKFREVFEVLLGTCCDSFTELNKK